MPAGGFRTSLVGLAQTLTSRFRSKPQSGTNFTQPDLTQFADVFQPSGGQFSPGFPLAPPEPEPVRLWDFPVGFNTVFRPRSYEPVKFEDLRALAENHDITRLAIETRKDQIEKLEWEIRPRDEDNETPDVLKRAALVKEFWHRPDGEQDFATWLREALEDMLVLDAPAFEVRRTRGGELIGLDIVDGSTIKVLIDDTGRSPRPPAPAYEQIIHGRPWRLLTRDELIYSPRNKRPHKVFGYSPVEQILITVNIGLRRQLMQLQHFTEGNVPAGIINATDGWTPEQIRQSSEAFDSILAGNTAAKTRIMWVPAGSKFQAFKEAPYKDDFDEWLARIVCFAFSLPPTPFTKTQNRGEQLATKEASLEEGMAPLMGWVKRFIDEVIQHRMGHPDLEFKWSDVRPIDAKDQSAIIDQKLRSMRMTLNEARNEDGMEPVEGGDEPMVFVATGPILLKDIINPPELPMPAAAPNGQPDSGAAANSGVPGKAPKPSAARAPTGKPEEAPAGKASVPFSRRARLRAGPARNVALLQRHEKRLSAKLQRFFADRANHVSAQIARELDLH